MSQMLGRVLNGRFELVRGLGAGGMGEVYVAFDRMLKNEVALKVLNPARAADPEMSARFLNEVRNLQQLNHSRIVPIRDCGQDDGITYYIMPLGEGQSLKEHLRLHGPLKVGAALDLVQSILEGLQHAHAKGILHRDIKPANILVKETGRGFEALILDFGISKSLLDDAGLTAPGTGVGTVMYAAPEQIQGEQATPSADLYSLGMTFLEMLTARRIVPEHGAPPRQPLLSDHPFPTAVLDVLNPVFRRVLERDPRKRYRTTAELAEVLREARQALPGPYLDFALGRTIPAAGVEEPRQGSTFVQPPSAESNEAAPPRGGTSLEASTPRGVPVAPPVDQGGLGGARPGAVPLAPGPVADQREKVVFSRAVESRPAKGPFLPPPSRRPEAVNGTHRRLVVAALVLLAGVLAALFWGYRGREAGPGSGIQDVLGDHYLEFPAGMTCGSGATRLENPRTFRLLGGLVTWEQYRRFSPGARPSPGEAPGDPVRGRSWEDCMGYCRWVGAKNGQTGRLPMRREWDFAVAAAPKALGAAAAQPQWLLESGGSNAPAQQAAVAQSQAQQNKQPSPALGFSVLLEAAGTNSQAQQTRQTGADRP